MFTTQSPFHNILSKRWLHITQISIFCLFISSYIVVEALHRSGSTILNIQPNPTYYYDSPGTLRPNFSATVFWDPRAPYSYSTTRQGFRSNANSKQIKCDTATPILCLGDSFTFSIGVADNLSYPATLERILNTRHDPRRFKTINAGTAGTGLDYHIQYYNDRLREIAHDVVIYQFYYFHIGHILRETLYTQKYNADTPIYNAIKNFILAENVSSWLNTQVFSLGILNPINSFMATQDNSQNILTKQKVQFSPPFPVTDEMKSVLSNSTRILDERNYPALEPAWDTYLSQLLAFHNAVKLSGKDFLFLIIPDKTQLGSYLNGPSAVIPKFLDAHGIKYIDFTPVFRSLYINQGINPFLEYDFHCNNTGNSIIAEAIAARTTFSDANSSKGISVSGNSKPRRYHSPRTLTLTMSDAGVFSLPENDVLTLTGSFYDNTHVKREAGGGVRYLTTNTEVDASARITLHFSSKRPLSQISTVFVPHVTGSDSTQNRIDVILAHGDSISSFSTSQLADLRRLNHFDDRLFLEGAHTTNPTNTFELSIHLLRDAGICYGDPSNEDSIRRIELYLYESESDD